MKNAEFGEVAKAVGLGPCARYGQVERRRLVAQLRPGDHRISKLRGKRPERKPQLVRLGHREIKTLGLNQGFWSDLYHRSMTVYWPVFFGSAAAVFVVLNAVFGFLYSLDHEPIVKLA